MIDVEQCDREAAADWLAADDDAPDMLHFASVIRAGGDDGHSLVQAFARHRLAERERCAKVAEESTGDDIRLGEIDRSARIAAAILSGKEPAA